MRDKPLFGTAGSPEDFYNSGYKTSLQMPEYLQKIGLDAFEYQCGRGVNVSKQTAQNLRDKSLEHSIALSVHSPYYINIASPDPIRQKSSFGHIVKTLEFAKNLGANRIVIHMGSVGEQERDVAMWVSRQMVKMLMHEVDELGFSNIHLCFETMGKINQLGTLEEVIEVCKIDERILPAIDFGHLNARTHGGIKTKEDYEKIINDIRQELGDYRAKNFHAHFSKIEWTEGGEKRHLTFSDTQFGPDFKPLAKVIAEQNLTPTIICESKGTQGIDALQMKKMYQDEI
ncbi:MAG: TIM barrel protein [Clostridiales bacterium]|nr:TIM barrel protein [Clostridiales bacterium]